MTFKEVEQMVLKWAKDRNILEGSSPTAQVIKLQEELNELKDAIDKSDITEAIDAVGDMLVVLTMIAYFLNTSLLECYIRAFVEIKDRKGKIVDGIFVKD
jgi:NTP pyrophosphatase (non-canonical NTP hydrolase)